MHRIHSPALSLLPAIRLMWRLLAGGMLTLALPSRPVAAEPATTLSREPAIDRDEARRMIPATPLREIAFDPSTLPPGIEPKRLSLLRQALTTTTAPEAAMQIRALEGFIDYDEADQMVYSPGRTQVNYGKYYLEADKLILDARLQEVQAEGNVILKIGEDVIHADSLRYNFGDSEGVANNVSGFNKPIYFRAGEGAKDKQAKTPQMEMLSQNESVFRNTRITTCDFKIPHYYVRGREVILFQRDRIFLRGATFYAMGFPCFYLPAYTRSLTEASPWFVNLGYKSRTGAVLRLGYSYRHQTEEPSLTDDQKYEVRSAGKADIFIDYLTKRGPGLGLDYKYRFDFDRNRGELELYTLSDQDRRVVGPDARNATDIFDESERWRAKWLHRTELLPNLSLVINVDEFSDPDIFYDVLDMFVENWDQRDRQVVRRSRAALTYLNEAYVMRMMIDVKDRIGRDRYNDFSNPRDDNRDFDLDPFTRLEKVDVDGISSERWGRVSAKLPQATFATRYLPLGRRPLYYDVELNAYYALDKGLNIVSRDDDAYVKGVELYQSLLHQWKFSPRYILLGKLGVGIGYAQRENNPDVDFPLTIFPQMIDALQFVDRDGTFLVGKHRRNLDDIRPFYLWSDAELEFNARISDALTGRLQWLYRKTTDDFIGDWYASLGSTTFTEDLYDYKIRRHWIRGNLTYRLLKPLMTVYVDGGLNLLGRNELYSKEPLGDFTVGTRWSNTRQTLVADVSTGWRQRQIYDPSDPIEYQENALTANARVSYFPIHKRWYALAALNYFNAVNGQTERDSDSRLTFFSDQDTHNDVKLVYGRQLGPKWNSEFLVRWDKQVGGLRELGLLLQRDFHDAIGVFKVSMRNTDRRVEDRKDQSPTELNLRLGVKFKIPGQEVAFGAGRLTTVRQRSHEPAVAY